MLDRLFLAHPRSVGESYAGHASVALRFSLRLFGASLACAVHGLLPFLFRTTGSRQVTLLHDRMVAHRRRAADQLAA